MAWRLARSLDALRDEVNRRWPNRSKVSDGTVGDAAHQARTSDHDANAAGVVRALDVTASGIDAPWYAEHIRELGAAGHPALANHGYVIWNRRAAYATNGWRWIPYTGTNPHDHHVHVSVGRDPAQYDDTRTWRIAASAAQDGLIAGNKNLELTVGQYEDIMSAIHDVRADVWKTKAQLDLVSSAIHGTNDANRDGSILWNTTYLRSELLGGDNAQRLREILHQYGVPKAAVTIIADND